MNYNIMRQKSYLSELARVFDTENKVKDLWRLSSEDWRDDDERHGV